MKPKVDQNESKPIKKSDVIDLKIAHLLIERPAITDDEIAKVIGLSRMVVNRRRKSEAVQSQIAMALALPNNELRRLMIKALKRVEELLDSSDPKLRAMAAIQLLRISIQAYAAKVPDVASAGEFTSVEITFADELPDSG